MFPSVTQPMLLLRASWRLRPSSSIRDWTSAMIQSGRNKFNRADGSSVGKEQQVTTEMARSTLHSTHPTITNHHHICCHVLDVAASSTHTCDGIQPSGTILMWRFLRKTKGRVVRRRLLVGNHLKPVMAARDQAVARWRDGGWEDAVVLPAGGCASHPQQTFERRHH